MKIVHRCVLPLYDRTTIESDAVVAHGKTFFVGSRQTTSLSIALLPSMCTVRDLGPQPVEVKMVNSAVHMTQKQFILQIERSCD
jgi:hypothetical protein